MATTCSRLPPAPTRHGDTCLTDPSPARTSSCAFDDLGNRRLEWKCSNENAGSKRAALRFGFTFEGLFRHHRVDKGRNRDTAWFSIIDSEWPACRAAFEAWLANENFDAAGRQRRSLADLREGIRAGTD